MKKIATISILSLALVFLAGCLGKKTTTTPAQPAATGQTSTGTPASTGAGTSTGATQTAGGSEIDQDIQSLDTEMNSINTDDFSESSAPDSELGL